MPSEKKTKNTRQEAVAMNHRDMSTEELAARINHASTLESLYVNQRTRNQRAIQEASSEVRTCDRMINELRADIATFNALIKQRRG